MSQTFLSAVDFWTRGQTSCKYTHSSRWSPPTSEQPGPVCTWVVQHEKVPCALYAFEPHDDAQLEAPQEDALVLTQRSGGGACAVGWWYMDKSVRGARCMLVLDGSHTKTASSNCFFLNYVADANPSIWAPCHTRFWKFGAKIFVPTNFNQLL